MVSPWSRFPRPIGRKPSPAPPPCSVRLGHRPSARPGRGRAGEWGGRVQGAALAWAVSATLARGLPAAARWPDDPRAQQERRARRVARYEQVRALRAEGLGLQPIGARVGLAPATVRRFARAAVFPERKRHPTGRRGLQPYEASLRERGMAGEHNAAPPWAEGLARGVTGAAVTGPPSLPRRPPTPR